jgi:hypothetical protein
MNFKYCTRVNDSYSAHKLTTLFSQLRLKSDFTPQVLIHEKYSVCKYV